LNILLGLSPLEVFVKCHKLRATKCTFVKHSSGIISPVILCKVLQTEGYKIYPLLNILLELSPLEAFVKCYKLRATKCTFVEHSSGIISPVILCKVLQIQGYKMYLVTFFWNYLPGKFFSFFIKCYKLRATKCIFVKHSSGIISP
jgi:hypothetical protein